jgi:hypothetical protein
MNGTSERLSGRDRRLHSASVEKPTVQYSNSTKANRYPAVFGAVADCASLAGFNKPKILSYGCSTGEEVDSLANLYFPDSEVVGVDVSDEALDEARRRFASNPRLRFEKSNQEFLRIEAPFSIIFAMSVLCRWPETRTMADAASIFPFEVFEHHVGLLDEVLAPGGLLIIYNANYSFLSSTIASKYDLILHSRIKNAGFVRRFQRSGKYQEGQIPSDCVYRKKADGEVPEPHRIVIRNGKLDFIGCLDRINGL